MAISVYHSDVIFVLIILASIIVFIGFIYCCNTHTFCNLCKKNNNITIESLLTHNVNNNESTPQDDDQESNLSRATTVIAN
jgi:nitrate/TMAO reductase-like tetraheme cytochrome c subunit